MFCTNARCGSGAQAPFCSKHGKHQNKFVALQHLSMVLAFSTMFYAAFPSWSSPATYFRLSGTERTCKEQGYEAGPTIAAPSLKLSWSWQGQWGGSSAFISDRAERICSHCHLSSSTEAGFFPQGHRYHISIFWSKLQYNTGHEKCKRIIRDHNTFCSVNVASEIAK